MSNLWEQIKNRIAEIVQSRIFVMIILFCVTTGLLVQRVFYLQIVKGQEYFDNYKLQIQKTKDVEGTRGNIYDRNGKLIAYNELAFSVTIEDNGDYDTKKQKNKELNKVVRTVIDMVESNGDTVINNFGIILDSDDNYIFVAESDTQRLRFIADVYGQATIDKLTKKQKAQSAEEIIHYLCSDEKNGYGINEEKYSKEEILKLINIRYAVSLNSYQKYIATTIAEDVSDETVSDIMENMDTLQGVNIQEESMRRYTDSKCFANIIGYTGQISVEEYDALSKEEQEEYDKNDTVGKSGLEKELDSYLRGKKGEVKLYVNNVGKVIETVQGKEAKAGNDVYLTIDADLQVAAYNILEQELAGILLSKLTNSLTFDRNAVGDASDIAIPIGDVYNAFISNDILDMNHFSEKDAGDVEKEVYDSFSSQKKKVLKELKSILNDSEEKAYKDMSKEYQAYLTYIVTDLLTTSRQVLMSDAIDTGDSTYKAWREDETINIYTYLNYAISKNWIDTSKLQEFMPESDKYSASTETYQALVDYILDALESNNGFDKEIYRYMIRNGAITGRQICMMLYEQEVLKYSEKQYNRLKSGELGSYEFIRSKIQNLQITPGQLGLEPCTGSLVMTDTNTGDVIACVSYPGYDNNRLANTMDSDYYNKLVTDAARPFYNNATQEKTAPGSTYKPLVAVAGLTEGVIDTSTVITCRGVYENVEPNPKCWIYPNAHGGLNVSAAIEHSCNSFFYDVGYRLSLTNKKTTTEATGEDATKKYYSSDVGTDTLAKYATEFGLNETSGLEVPEAEPQISDESSVPSAIGQGTNNYTTSQLARYVTAIANKGTVYSLTLLDKVTTASGKVVKEFKNKEAKKIENVSSSTWDAVHKGMRDVVLGHADIFSELSSYNLELSGKTGTAQQSKTHPDHGLFIGYAPSSSPEIAFAVRIANGYSSSRAAEVGREVMKYYYDLVPEDEIITGEAAAIGSSSAGD